MPELALLEFLKKYWFDLLIIIAIGFLVGFSKYYKDVYSSEHDKYVALQTLQKATSDEAKQKLDELTKQLAAKQTIIDQQSQLQVQKDEQAKIQVKNVVHDVVSKPVRVRIVAVPASGCGSGSTDNATSSNAAIGAANASTAIGLLPQSNTQQLASAIGEIETLNIAFGSCKATLTNWLNE